MRSAARWRRRFSMSRRASRCKTSSMSAAAIEGAARDFACSGPSCRKPPGARHRAAAHRLDAGRGLAERLADDLHVMAAGVQELVGIAHDPDMSLPEHEVAAPQAG